MLFATSRTDRGVVATLVCVIAFCAAAIVLTSCAKDETSNLNSQTSNPTEVTITFGKPYEQQAMTRAAKSIASVCTHLDVWIEHEGDVIDIHQTSSDADFGTITAVLDKRYTYTINAVAHKCDGDATLTDGVISFPDDKVTHAMVYQGTVSPATTTSLSAEMTRIVAQFKLETTDAIPDEAKKMRFTITDVYNRWNVSTGATNKLDRTSEVNISSKNANGTATFMVYAITTDAETTHTVTVSALDEGDNVLQTRTFAGVTLRNGYKTSYRGQFFTDQDFTSSFVVADWSEYDTVDF